MANVLNSGMGAFLKGAIAGAAAVWVMDRVTWYMYKNEDPMAYKQEKEAQIEGKYASHVAADKITNALGVELTDKQHEIAGQTVHYLIGAVPAAIYGATRKNSEGFSPMKGLLFGFGLFAAMDEGVVPLLGLGSRPKAYPWQAHVRGLVGHLVFGLATEAALTFINNPRNVIDKAGPVVDQFKPVADKITPLLNKIAALGKKNKPESIPQLG